MHFGQQVAESSNLDSVRTDFLFSRPNSLKNEKEHVWGTRASQSSTVQRVSYPGLHMGRFAWRHVLLCLTVAWSVAYIAMEPGAMMGVYPPYLSTRELQSTPPTLEGVTRNEPNQQQQQRQQQQRKNNKVILVVVDGMSVMDVQQMGYFDADPSTTALFRLVQAQLPSTSVPNWITLLSGASPQMHGYYAPDVETGREFQVEGKDVCGPVQTLLSPTVSNHRYGLKPTVQR